jgi:hypothetical protein
MCSTDIAVQTASHRPLGIHRVGFDYPLLGIGFGLKPATLKRN